MDASFPAIHCRQITDAEVPAVTALLARGLPSRNEQFWRRALRQLGKRNPPPGLPKYGYLLESRGAVVGTVLMICATIGAGDKRFVRCNLSSWYVEPAFRAYAPLLVSRALAHKDVTYLNVSAAPHTWPIIEAMGFARYCDGIFVSVPILNGLSGNAGAKVLDAHVKPCGAPDPSEQEILLQHADLGCISVWCQTANRAYPFVFRPRLVKKIIPCAQLIYCRDTVDFVRFAGPIGRFLARRRIAFVIVDANGPIPGLIGVYRPGSMPKYFRGPQRPRLGDLAYTEYAVMGV